MGDGPALRAAVMFVRDLDRSVAFYRDLLDLRVSDASTTAALLINDDGSQLVLRATGANATHSLGSVGVQYLAWTTATRADLDRRADILRRHSAYIETRTDPGVTVVEGRDPDDVVVILVYADGRGPMQSIPARVYAW